MEKRLDEKNAEVLDEKYLHVKTTYPKFCIVFCGRLHFSLKNAFSLSMINLHRNFLNKLIILSL